MMGTTIPRVPIITLIPSIIKPPIIIPFLPMKPMLLFLPPAEMMSIMTYKSSRESNNFIPTQHPQPGDLCIARKPEASELVFGLSVLEDLAPFTVHRSVV